MFDFGLGDYSDLTNNLTIKTGRTSFCLGEESVEDPVSQQGQGQDCPDNH